MMLMLAVFIGGMLFEHFVFHKIEEKAMEIYKKVNDLFH